MAQLPPKVPNMTPNWHDFPHQRMASMENLPSNTAIATATATTQWIDEFLDFSSAKRGSHRRSISDSIAFIEPSIMVEECRRSSAPGSRPNIEFERFDDEQLMSMFADEVAVAPTMSLSNTSTPSDHNSINDEDKPAPLDQMKNEAEKSEGN